MDRRSTFRRPWTNVQSLLCCSRNGGVYVTCACLFLARFSQRRTNMAYLVNKACNGRDLTTPEDSLAKHTLTTSSSIRTGRERIAMDTWKKDPRTKQKNLLEGRGCERILRWIKTRRKTSTTNAEGLPSTRTMAIVCGSFEG